MDDREKGMRGGIPQVPLGWNRLSAVRGLLTTSIILGVTSGGDKSPNTSIDLVSAARSVPGLAHSHSMN